jgi:DNA-binding MarR family transcriptional regulator
MRVESKLTYDYVERLSELLRIDSRQAGADHGLQPVQLEALHYLSICNRYSDTPAAVTESLGQTKGTVSKTLRVLKRKGLLSKQLD